MQLSLLVLRCKNIEASKNFIQYWGCLLLKKKHGDGPRHYSCSFKGIVLELYPNKGQSPQDNNRLGFKIDNLESALTQVTVDSTYAFANNTIYVTTDPDGRKVELSQ